MAAAASASVPARAAGARPPGPRGLPLLGALPEYASDPLQMMLRVARDYGDVAYMRLFVFDVYQVNRPDLAEEVLRGHAGDVMKDFFTRALKPIAGEGLLTSDGAHWRRQRRLAQPAFHKDRIEGYAKIMVDESRRLAAGWRDGDARDLHKDLSRLTLEIVTRALFGGDAGADADVVGSALDVVMDHFSRTYAFVPGVSALLFWQQLRVRRAVRRIDEVVGRLVETRRASGRDTGDLLSMLLAARDEDGRPMDDRQLRDEAVTILLAGHETTALALTWTFWLLSRHPEAEARVHAEVDALLGGRDATAGDLRRLQYCDAVVREAMRLYPPAWAIGREPKTPIVLDGWTIPAGAQVTIAPWVLHRDARWFESPEAFRPERWLDGLADRLPRFAYMPFGGGPRVCIGQGFAQLEAVLVLATLAQSWRAATAPGHAGATLPSVTLRMKGGLPVRLSRRAPAPAPAAAAQS